MRAIHVWSLSASFKKAEGVDESRRVSAENETTSKEQQRQELMKQMPQGSKVDDKLMDTMGDMLLVETVALQSGSKENGYTCVSPRSGERKKKEPRKEHMLARCLTKAIFRSPVSQPREHVRRR